ncbi:pyruvate kinase [Desulfotomaculum arcticum]|uniref:Pyruvate kinase n=1 Tax=Desulfotruncus arcticus DSM 17038 TaxID=1121424 RepID=A0A1I2N0D0_9FIRM|nr:pyruvate kinase [Desulfotruncus arcticus]SFF97314.1 pyruvate kinase [Desulfotomaculum arcticum] [Desulfotruncus arcticus DSM 17038]
MRRTKIVCTIGPVSESVELMEKMMLTGMNVARLNFSHGTHEEHAKRIKAIRKAAGNVGKNVAIMLDTKGPEIRLGLLEKEPVELKAGAEVCLTTDNVKGTEQLLPVTYKGLPGDVKTGDRILISDGLIALRVQSVDGPKIFCIIENGGKITSQKGVNVPGVNVSLPSLTENDKTDIIFGIENNLDFVAASFIRKASDVLAIRRIIEENNGYMDIISKIESREAVLNLDEIIKVSDGIMVARGDLGVEIPPEEVPLIQKSIIEKCNHTGKPVITATQMLESMIQNPRPTRAEASDVANAILDGTDAIMLSGETAAGKYPIESVETMARIAAQAESAIKFEELLKNKRRALSKTVTDAISHATVTTALDLGAAAIISSTEAGYTAKMVSKYRPRAPIIAATPHTKVLRKLAIVWGVQPLLVARTEDTDSMINAAVEVSLAAGLIKAGDLTVITAGVPVGVHGTTNLIKVHTVGDIIARGTGIGNKAVTGSVCVVGSWREAKERLRAGQILVTYDTDRDFIPAIEKAAAIITEVGGLTSHAAIVGLEFGIPVIVGLEGATSIIPDGEIVTVDGQRGLVYKGTARVL